MEVRLPEKTYVIDRRLVAAESTDIPARYIADSGTLPSEEEIRTNSAFLHRLKGARVSASKPYRRWMVFGVMVASFLGGLWLFRKLSRS